MMVNFFSDEVRETFMRNIAEDPAGGDVAFGVSDVAAVWKDAANRRLAQHRYNTQPVIQSTEVSEPFWEGPTSNPRRGQLTVDVNWTHPAADFFNFGTDPHVIEGNPWLVFEWENAPPNIQEIFPGDPPVVKFRSVNHPGTEAIRYIEAGRDAAERFVGTQTGADVDFEGDML